MCLPWCRNKEVTNVTRKLVPGQCNCNSPPDFCWLAGSSQPAEVQGRTQTGQAQPPPQSQPQPASQPLKSEGPPIQAQGSRNVNSFFVISCLRILKQLIRRNRYTLRLPPLSWPGGSWDFRGWLLAGFLAACLAVGGRLALAASGWLQHIRLSTAVEWEARPFLESAYGRNNQESPFGASYETETFWPPSFSMPASGIRSTSTLRRFKRGSFETFLFAFERHHDYYVC